jgi:hypothetical protein
MMAKMNQQPQPQRQYSEGQIRDELGVGAQLAPPSPVSSVRRSMAHQHQQQQQRRRKRTVVWRQDAVLCAVVYLHRLWISESRHIYFCGLVSREIVGVCPNSRRFQKLEISSLGPHNFAALTT